MFAGKKSAQIREILISESAWEEMTCLFAPSLADMQQLVGGYIEAVKLNPVIVHENIRYCWLVINEEGKLLSLPVNKNATILVKSVIGPDDYIVGNALMLEETEFQ